MVEGPKIMKTLNIEIWYNLDPKGRWGEGEIAWSSFAYVGQLKGES